VRQLLKLALSVCIAIFLNIGIVHASVKPHVNADNLAFISSEIECLAKNIYYEVGIESTKSKDAVAQVTLNRLSDGRWGKTICQVVYSKHQFSWTDDRHRKRPEGIYWHESIDTAYFFLIYGYRDKHVGNALYFHETRLHYQKWTKGMKKICVIGRHVFYSEK
jgi:spore germination cell wall hydrolase CwlJ-like protein